MKKMKSVKKTVAFLLVASILIGTTACGKKEEEDTKNPGSESVTVSNGEVSSEAVPLSIHWHSNNKYTLNDDDGNLKPVFALAADRTNTIVTSEGNPVSTDSKAEFELQATKQFPYDIYGGNGLRDSIFSYAHEGAFIPLNDLIDSYAPNIKKYLEENPDVRKAMTDADGNIYMLNYVPDGVAGRVWVIRTDWLDALNLEVPKTVEDLENFLYAFKNDDPNGNGEQDEIPLFNDKYTEIIRTATLWGARVYGEDNSSERVVMDNDGKFYHAWTADAFKEAMINMAKWYKDGIIDPEVFTRKSNTARPTFWTTENVGGCTHEWLASTTAYNYNSDLLAATPDFKVEAFLPPSYNGADGFEEHNRAQIKPDGWAISANCKNPEAAIRFMDWFYSEEGNRATNYGIEDESYTMVDGKPVFTDEVLSQTGVNSYIQKTYGAQYPLGYAKDYNYESQWTVKEGQEAYDLYSNSDAYSVPMTPIMNFTDDERAIYDKYITPLNTYLDEEVQGFITGTIDVEAEWDSYVQKCNDLGAQELVDLYQKIYDERLK